MRYKIFDKVIASDIDLVELPALGAEAAGADLRFECSSQPLAADADLQWYHHWQNDDEEPSISGAHCGQGYLLRFPGFADFLIDSDLSVIRGYLVPGGTLDTIRHLLIDQVIPRIMAQRGALVLHGSAVSLPGEQARAIAFLGETGWGKSTLATSFHRAGYRLLGDDCVLLRPAERGIELTASYPGARLIDDSVDALIDEHIERTPVAHYSGKSRVTLAGLADAKAGTEDDGSHVLAAAFVLNDPRAEEHRGEPQHTPMRGTAAFAAFTRNGFHLDVTDRAQLRRHFYDVGQELANRVPVYSLAYERCYDRLHQVHTLVRELIS